MDNFKGVIVEDVPLELMPNPEILPDPEKVKQLFTQERARRMLDAAENLLAALNTMSTTNWPCGHSVCRSI